MPLGKHFGGNGEKVAESMKRTYGDDWERVFYATENAQKSEGSYGRQSRKPQPRRKHKRYGEE